MTEVLQDSESSSLANQAVTLGRVFEFQERSLADASISTQLKLFFNDCDRRSIYLLQRAESYRWYSRYTVFASTSMMLGTGPFFYWLFAAEYTVARTRNPAKVRSYWTIGSVLFLVSSLMKMFAMSNVGFGAQSHAMVSFAAAYDVLAWEARRFQHQLTDKIFDSEAFVTHRKLEFGIADDERSKAALKAKEEDKMLDKKQMFADLLHNKDVEEHAEGLETAEVRKQKRRAAFEKRCNEDKIAPSSIAYYEFCDKKKVLDGWY